jgi:lactoylglutathione lyase
MVLNHLNLAVTDVGAAKAFLETYFGLTATPGVGDDERFALLRDDAGMAVTLMRGAAGAEVSYPGTFHIGFIQPTEEAVNALNKRLAQGGHDVRPPKHFHGSWTFYAKAPGGFSVEVLC